MRSLTLLALCFLAMLAAAVEEPSAAAKADLVPADADLATPGSDRRGRLLLLLLKKKTLLKAKIGLKAKAKAPFKAPLIIAKGIGKAKGLAAGSVINPVGLLSGVGSAAGGVGGLAGLVGLVGLDDDDDDDDDAAAAAAGDADAAAAAAAAVDGGDGGYYRVQTGAQPLVGVRQVVAVPNGPLVTVADPIMVYTRSHRRPVAEQYGQPAAQEYREPAASAYPEPEKQVADALIEDRYPGSSAAAL